MLKNYILIAWRNLHKNHLFSSINIIGLALSMSVCMIVLIRIIDSFSYDNFHADSNRIYRIISEVENGEGNKWLFASSPLPLAATLEQESQMIGEVTQLYPAVNDIVKDGAREFHVNGTFAQPSFFTLFRFRLLYGNEQTALTQPNSIVLSQVTSEKFYGDANPVGKLLTLDKLGIFQITGVIKSPQSKSHIAYDVFASASSIAALEKSGVLPDKSNSWNSFEQGYTYVKIKNDSRSALINSLNRISADINKDPSSGSVRLQLQSLSSITPGASDIYNDIGRGPSRGSLMAEAGIVFIILLAACFNYTNLSIARALTRGKEVGIRKLSGAQRWQIFAQYIIEAIMIALFALCIANVVLAFILEYKPFNDGYEMVPAVTISLQLLAVFIGFSVFAGMMAGALPAWILSSFKPTRVLKNIGSERLMGNLSLRKVLMVFQFSLSLVILVFLSAFYHQFDYIAKADPGFNREHIVLIPVGENKKVVASALERVSGVKRIAFTSDAFGKNATGTLRGSVERNDPQPVNMNFYYGDGTLVNVMGLELIAGVNLDSSATASQNILMNEKTTRALGFKTPATAVGATIYLNDSLRVTITGVVNDFYDQGYGNSIKPVVIRNLPDGFNYLALEIEPSAQHSIVPRLEEEWKRIHPDHAFAYSWLDKKMEEWNDQSAEVSLLGFLGFMTVAIASMGLLGLVVYTVETRRKEISVRKIIGASVHQIVSLLSGGFVKLLMISGIIALPIGFGLSQLFLMNFANRVSFGLIEISLCFGLLLLIGLITILSQTYTASQENPSRNLRSE